MSDWQGWTEGLSAGDRAVIEAAGYDGRGAVTFDSRRAAVRPALLVIDMQRLFVGPDAPILEAIAQERTMIGEAAHAVARQIGPLAERFRAAGLPVIYMRMIPNGRAADDPLLDIVPEIQPHAGDIVIDKRHMSSFHQTDLDTLLKARGVDGLVLTGNSTSGCVRAAAVDGMQRGYGVVVAADAVCDRIEASHRAALLDIWMKIGRVMPSAEIGALIQARQS